MGGAAEIGRRVLRVATAHSGGTPTFPSRDPPLRQLLPGAGADAGAGDAPAGARADDHADALFAGHELPVPAHGWGLQILRSLAERYGGSLKTGGEDGRWFRTTVMLINERPAKNAPGGGRSAKETPTS